MPEEHAPEARAPDTAPGPVPPGPDEHWYKNAVLYSLDVKTFRDTSGNGYGDFRGLTASLDHIERLGATCIWLQPFYPSPGLDNGYDVADYYGVDPRLGDLDDFRAFVDAAHARGMRVVIDMVLDHTSVEHPWFREACRDPDSPYREYYLITHEPPEKAPERRPVDIEETGAWCRHEESGLYYYHSFFPFQPDLDLAHPAVRGEAKRVMDFWLDQGVDGFRMDAIPEIFGPYHDERFGDEGLALLDEWSRHVRGRREDAVLVGEVDMPPARYRDYFGTGERLPLLFNFYLTEHLFLSLAREDATPLGHALHEIPRPARHQGYVNFLRSHDELSFRQLEPDEAEQVFSAYAPDPRMRIFRRGVRRRLAPLLHGERRDIEMAFSLLLSMPGVPMIEYGDEIGMGEDLDRPERHGIRTPMQWASARNGGFSDAPEEELVRSPIRRGGYGFERVNVEAQRGEPGSLLEWLGRAVRVRKGLPVLGRTDPEIVASKDPSVLALLYRDPDAGALLTVHNLSSRPRDAEIALPEDLRGSPSEILQDHVYPPIEAEGGEVKIGGRGYRWFRFGP